MFRRSSAQTPRADHRRAAAAMSLGDVVKGAVIAMLAQVGIYDQAMRENRKFDRVAKRRFKHGTYSVNGKRECQRRMRQIARGQLTAANGLLLAPLVNNREGLSG